MIHRIGFFILALAAIALGLVVGTLNSAPVAVDLLWLQIEWPLGLVIIVSLVIGFAIGMMLIWLTTVLPLRLRLRKTADKGDHRNDLQQDPGDG